MGLRQGHAGDHWNDRAAPGAAGRDRLDDPVVRAVDPRARLVAVSLHQQHHGDVGPAARLLRRRQCRKDRGFQPGADRLARCSDRRRQLAVAIGKSGRTRATDKIRHKNEEGVARMKAGIARTVAMVFAMAGLAMVLGGAPARAEGEFGSPELIAAAKAEGKLVFYTANFAEVEQQVIKEFNKRFPEIKVEMVRAPGGQLITRVKTEAAAGKLIADVVDHSDRALMADLVDLFQDYAPPNAADYNPDAQISPKLWPRATLVWSIAYNTELVKDPPKTWMDLTKPQYDKMTGQVFAQSGGTTWTRIMFERQVLGEDYWAKQATTHPILYPSGAPLADSLVRGEIAMGPLLYNAIYPKQKDGAPVKMVFPPEGAPVNPYASGIPKTAAHPNAARLYLNWCLSKEGQTFMIKELGNLTSLKESPVYPEGFDPKVVKVWYPNFEQYVKLHAAWVADWDKTFGYRQ